MNHVDSQSAKHGHPREDLEEWNMWCWSTCMCKMLVEKKLTNLAYISTKQNKADLMTKCHTSEAHKRGLCDDRIETRLKQNKEVKMQCEKKSTNSDWRRNENTKTGWRRVRSSEEMWDQDKVSRPQGGVRRITQAFQSSFQQEFLSMSS